MSEKIRFGRQITDLPVELEFGDWGVMETAQALDLFDDAHAYFCLLYTSCPGPVSASAEVIYRLK